MEPIGNGSEGDAYRYTKKVLKSLPNAMALRSIYEEIAAERGISSWTRAAYQDLRAHFFRDGQCKIRFAPGAARIAFGELSLGTGDEEPEPIGRLHDIIRIISIAHADEYDRYLGKDGELPTFKDFDAIYGKRIAAHWGAMRRQLRRRKYGPRRYTIIPLDNFETANRYYEYTKPHGWCHLGTSSMFEHYRMTSANGHSLPVKLYLAVLPGFEDMKETDELYGESMLGIDIGPGGRLVHVNNRWNHAHDNVDERKGDNKYDEVELSDLLGGPFFELCPPHDRNSYREYAERLREETLESNRSIREKRRELSGCIASGRRHRRTEGTFTDPRDGQTYRTMSLGGRTWLAEPMRFAPGEVLDIPENVDKLLDCGTPEVKVFVPTLDMYQNDDGTKEFRVNWMNPYDGVHGKEYVGDMFDRVATATRPSVYSKIEGSYVVTTRSRYYTYLDGEIDVYEPVYNVFIDAVRIGDRLIDGNLLEDLSRYYDFGPDAGWRVTNVLENTESERETVIRTAMEEAGMPCDPETVKEVSGRIVEEYTSGSGLQECRLMSSAEWQKRPSSVLLLHRPPQTRNLVGCRSRELITYRLLSPDSMPEGGADAVRALGPNTSVRVAGEDGSQGVLYRQEDEAAAIPDGWRLPNHEDLYRLYAAIGARVQRTGANRNEPISLTDYRKTRLKQLGGVRIPQKLSKTYEFPVMTLDDSATGEYDIGTLCKMIGFSSLARLSFHDMSNYYVANYSGLLGHVAPLVMEDTGMKVSCVDLDGNVRPPIHFMYTSCIGFKDSRLQLGMRVERFEDMTGGLAAIHGEEGLRIAKNPSSMYGRRFLFLVKD